MTNLRGENGGAFADSNRRDVGDAGLGSALYPIPFRQLIRRPSCAREQLLPTVAMRCRRRKAQRQPGRMASTVFYLPTTPARPAWTDRHCLPAQHNIIFACLHTHTCLLHFLPSCMASWPVVMDGDGGGGGCVWCRPFAHARLLSPSDSFSCTAPLPSLAARQTVVCTCIPFLPCLPWAGRVQAWWSGIISLRLRPPPLSVISSPSPSCLPVLFSTCCTFLTLSAFSPPVLSPAFSFSCLLFLATHAHLLSSSPPLEAGGRQEDRQEQTRTDFG